MPDQRIVIVGGPRTGKTTLAATLGIENIRSTDSLLGSHAWGDDSESVAIWMTDAGPWVIEGVTTARALRKFMRIHPDHKPADTVLVRFTPVVDVLPGQMTMGRGVRTVFEGIRHELMARGVTIG